MTDKLPPAHLRDLAELIWRNTTVGDLLELSRAIEKEAARREAEAKTHVCEFLPGLDGVDACHGCGRKLLPKELGQTRSGEARDTATPLHLPPQVEREGLDSADAELVKRLKDRARLWSKDLPGNVAPEQSIWWEAADRIEAQAREIADAQRAALSAQDSAITANARWNDSFRAAEQFKSERDTLKARVAELEADMKHMWPAADDAQSVFIDGHGFVSLDYDDARLKRAEQAEAKAARLVQSLGAISLFGITGDQFVSQGPGLALKRLREAVACAERALAGAGHAGK